MSSISRHLQATISLYLPISSKYTKLEKYYIPCRVYTNNKIIFSCPSRGNHYQGKLIAYNSQKRKNFKKDLTTSLFLSKPLCLQGFQRGRCLANRSLNTSLNRSLFLAMQPSGERLYSRPHDRVPYAHTPVPSWQDPETP